MKAMIESIRKEIKMDDPDKVKKYLGCHHESSVMMSSRLLDIICKCLMSSVARVTFILRKLV